MKIFVIPVTASVLVTQCVTSIAAEIPRLNKRVLIQRTEDAPIIDGRIAPGEWALAATVSDMQQVEPVEGEDATEKTVWYLTYDDRTLYIAGHAFDRSPEAVVARVLRQGGSLESDDAMHVIIDAFNNKRSGYSFGLNPNGVRRDAIFSTATRESDDWEGVWRGEAMRTIDGWTMEMAIPFNTLTFDPSSDTWGMNFRREIPRKDEKIAWRSRNGKVDPTVSGEVYGFRRLSQGIGLDVIPSFSSTYTNDRELDSSDNEQSPSLDISYKLTPSINALLTINTDFAATEVDNRQLDLQRFSLFFPEKRSFFLTDFDIFQFGGVPTSGGFRGGLIGVESGPNGMPFFSRRIGLSDTREPVDLIAGGKVSGRLGDYDFGTLLIRQDDYVNDDMETIDATDLFVARVSRGIFEESSLGAIVTYGDPQSNLDSSLVGVDYIYRNTRLGASRSMEGQFWVQKSDNEGVGGDDMAWNVALGFPAQRGFEGGLQVHEVQENYDPALGFANRTGVRLYSGKLGHRWLTTESRLLQRFNTEVEYKRWEFLDTGDVQTEELAFNALNFLSRAGDFTRLAYAFHKEGLLPGEQPLEDLGISIPAGEHSFERYIWFIRTARHRGLSFQMRFDDGGFFNGDRFHVRPEVEWRPNEHLYFRLRYDYNKFEFPDAEAITRLISFENDVVFNSKLSIRTIAQYDNISDDIGINTRFRYNRAAGQDFWFVLNHNMTEDPIEDRFRSVQTSAAAKIRYTFRF